MECDVVPGMELIRKTKRLDGCWDMETLCQLCDDLVDYDRRIEKVFRWIKWGILILGFAVAFGAVKLLGPVGLILTVCGVVIAVVIASRIFKSFDVPNEVRLYLKPLLFHLTEDCKSSQPVSIQMELSPLEKRANQVTKSQPYSQGAYHKVVDYTYKRCLVRLNMRLYDGNRLRVTLQETLKKSVRTKRNPRGKIKTKTKYKNVLDYSHKLYLNQNEYRFSSFPSKSLDFKGHAIEMFADNKGNGLACGVSVKQHGKATSPDWKTNVNQIIAMYGLLQVLEKKRSQGRRAQ